MKHPGKIVITDNKVKFEYYELEKPYTPPFSCDKNLSDIKTAKGYLAAMVKYEASKRVIETVNETYPVTTTTNAYWILLSKKWRIVKDGQNCKTEVENNVATIIKIN